ncbi:MAG: hypothetical protein IPK69_09845 [Phycisphaerales bacterium]|nr:MAG: hypothetical protein IPK69_09845 [Phycisphaerales bacterium]
MKFVRSVLAILAGFVSMAIPTMGVFAVSAFAFGREVLMPEDQARAPVWFSLGIMVVGLACTMLGGFVCAKVARSWMPVMFFAAIVLVFGIFSAIGNERKPEPGPEVAEMPILEAVAHSKEPTWLAFGNPIVGALGVLLGGRLAIRERIRN